MQTRYWHDLADRVQNQLPMLQQQIAEHLRATYAAEGRGCVVVLRYTDPVVPTWIGYTTPTRYPPVLAAVMPTLLPTLASYDPATTYVVVQAQVGADVLSACEAQVAVYPLHPHTMNTEGESRCVGA